MSSPLAPLALSTLLLAGGSPPQDVVDVAVSRRGFQPGVLSARVGETLRLRLTASDAEHCFALDALRIEKRIVPGRPTVLELTPEQTGRFPFYCCLEESDSSERGALVVGE